MFAAKCTSQFLVPCATFIEHSTGALKMEECWLRKLENRLHLEKDRVAILVSGEVVRRTGETGQRAPPGSVAI